MVMGPATLANGLSMVLVMTAAHGWGPVASWCPGGAAAFALQFVAMAFVNDFGARAFGRDSNTFERMRQGCRRPFAACDPVEHGSCYHSQVPTGSAWRSTTHPSPIQI